MSFSKSFENGPNSRHMLFWFKKQFQKCITHGSSWKIDVYQAVLKYPAIISIMVKMHLMDIFVIILNVAW